MTGTALVTGAARGIGHAIAERLVRDGYDVVIADVEVESVTKAAADLGARAVVLDVTDPVATRRCAQELGPVSVLVNNAGIMKPSSLRETTAADFRAVMDVNVLGPLLMTQAFAEGLVVTGGSVVNVASMSSAVPVPGTGIYPASKAAIAALTEGLALELGPVGVRVNAVAPGRISTEMTASRQQDPAREARTNALIPLGRSGRGDDIADVVSFLASTDARYVSGQVVYVDGGLTVGTVAFFQAAQG